MIADLSFDAFVRSGASADAIRKLTIQREDTMRGTLAQEAVEAMTDARASAAAAKAVEPTDAEKLEAYQAATAAIMATAATGADHVIIEHANHALLRYVGQALTNQGLRVNFDFVSGKLAARWG